MERLLPFFFPLLKMVIVRDSPELFLRTKKLRLSCIIADDQHFVNVNEPCLTAEFDYDLIESIVFPWLLVDNLCFERQTDQGALHAPSSPKNCSLRDP